MTNRSVPAWVLAGLAVVLAVVASVALWVAPGPSAQPRTHAPVSSDATTGYEPGTVPGDDGGAVVAAARALPLALGYDYRSLRRDLDRATDLMTDDFGVEFRRTFQDSAGRLARTQRAVTSATVRAAGLVRADKERASCLVYVDQVLVSSSTMRDTDAPVRVTQSRVLVGLRREHDRWLVDSIAPF